MKLDEQIYKLIIETSTQLPNDVKQYINNISNSKIIDIMKETIKISSYEKLPICQDTGFPYFQIDIPHHFRKYQEQIKNSIEKSLIKATKNGFLRPNSVDPISNKNWGNNTGILLPYIDWKYTDTKQINCKLLLKGGGSENASMQYTLPFDKIKANRDKQGIINTVLYHIQKIGGQGCSPGIIGLGIGGDRQLSFKLAKNQLFRPIDDINLDTDLKQIENEILTKANKLEIGPMGLGGSPTLIAVKAAKAARHPASFFISISYLCWVARRNECKLNIS